MKKLLLETHSAALVVYLLSGTIRTEVGKYPMEDSASRIGNIYKGRILHVEPSLQACFVDIGEERASFLSLREVAPNHFHGGKTAQEAELHKVLRTGQELLVQVRDDENDEQGSTLSTFIELPGLFLVFHPFGNKHEHSQSNKNDGQQVVLPAGCVLPTGMAIRQSGNLLGSAREVETDGHYLRQLWQAIETAGNAHPAPFLIYQETAPVIRVVRDHFQPDIMEISVDSNELYEQLRQYLLHVMPAAANRVRRANPGRHPFPASTGELPAAARPGVFARLRKMLKG